MPKNFEMLGQQSHNVSELTEEVCYEYTAMYKGEIVILKQLDSLLKNCTLSMQEQEDLIAARQLCQIGIDRYEHLAEKQKRLANANKE